jgi:type II secretory pathway component PulK
VFSSRRKQSGLALLLALMIVVIATTIAVSIIHEEKFTIRKTGHIYTMDRATVLSVGMEDYARVILREDRKDSDVDSLDESWANGVMGQPFQGGFFTGYLEDEQAKFNLNTIVISEVALERFERLCDNLGVDADFIPALMDWIDEDSEIRYPDGMEENYESYRVANREMADISELLLVFNFEAEDYEKLSDAGEFIEQREDSVYDSVGDFIERLEFPVQEEGLGVQTKYFRAYGQVTLGEQVYNLSSLIYRDDKGVTTVMNRTLGVF